jgi:hypothetical protein
LPSRPPLRSRRVPPTISERWSTVGGAAVDIRQNVVPVTWPGAAWLGELQCHPIVARTPETGRWQARFTDGRTGEFSFAGSTTDSGAYLIASFDPASDVIGIRPRVPHGRDAHLLATCAQAAGIGVVPS